MQQNIMYWVRFSLVNLVAVAVLGVLMRYKIAFDFPFLQQKFIQHAHSHFAFSGWVSQALFVLMVYSIISDLPEKSFKKYSYLFFFNLINAYGMLVSFSLQGYKFFSITFSTLSIIIAFIFAWMYIKDLRSLKNNRIAKNWYIAALLFNILSSFGTFTLAFLMARGHIIQELYLASIYFFLHFQYNGWFLFAVIGLFTTWMQSNFSGWRLNDKVFWMFLISCIPAYGLSLLWLNLSDWALAALMFFALLQLSGYFYMIKEVKQLKTYFTGMNFTSGLLLSLAAICLSIKLILQFFSTIPALNTLAFGSRPIIIAYLHLVLLGVITFFILAYMTSNKLLKTTRFSTMTLVIFIIGVFLNELFLLIQGLGGIWNYSVPQINHILFAVTICMFTGIFLFASDQIINRNRVAREPR